MPQDRIQLEGMVFYGFHGIDPAERELGQRFVVDLEAYQDLRPAGLSDDPQDTTSYSQIYRVVKEIVEGPAHHLLESLAEAIAQRVLGDFEVDSVRIRVRKPQVPIKGSVLSHAGVEVFRDRTRQTGA